MKENTYFMLFANCIPVKGAVRSTICDLQRGNVHIVPNDLYDIVLLCKQQSLSYLIDSLEKDDIVVFKEYIEFMLSNNLGMLCTKEELDLFPQIDLTYHDSSIISSAIIDIGDNNFDYGPVIQELHSLGCKNLQIRMYNLKNINFIDNLLRMTNLTRINSIELFLKYEPALDIEKLTIIGEEYLRINKIIVHSSAIKIDNLHIHKRKCDIMFIDEVINNESHCGFVSPSYFSVNISVFSESKEFNTCLNKKISVDQYGFIKNCPAMKENFGHISNTSLEKAVLTSKFKDLWNISKEQVEICCDCEFRYICTDCRAFITDSNNLLSKPLRCSYNPYEASWGQ